MLEMPCRDTGLSFPLDTNRINARQRDNDMNKLEKWADNDVIWLYMSEPANIEAKKGGAAQRYRKLRQFGPTMLTLAHTVEERAFMRQIANTLFPNFPKNENEWRDVEIVFNAKKYPGSLITEDDDILGKRTQLSNLGINVYTTSEAVKLVRRRIRLRDNMARKVATRTGNPLPSWVGKD